MFFAFSCNNFQLLETKKAAPEKWKTAKKIDLISYLNDIVKLIQQGLLEMKEKEKSLLVKMMECWRG